MLLLHDTFICTELSRDEPLLHDLNTDAVEVWGLIPTVSCHIVLKIRQELRERGWVTSVETLLINGEVWRGRVPSAHWCFKGRAPAVPSDHTPALLPQSHSHFLRAAWQEIRQVIRQPAASSLLLIGWREMCHSAKKTTCWRKPERCCCQVKMSQNVFEKQQQ